MVFLVDAAGSCDNNSPTDSPSKPGDREVAMADRGPQSSQGEFQQQLAAARSGNRKALGELLNPFRRILRRRAAQRLQLQLTAKEWPSDIVQDTYLSAVQGFSEFRGSTEKELYAWLRTILERETSNCQRYYYEGKRRVSLEVPLDQQSEEFDFKNALVASGSSPAFDTMRGEQARSVQAAMDQLPDLYREVVQLHVWHNLPFASIGGRLGHSPEAVRKYWVRAKQRLTAALKHG